MPYIKLLTVLAGLALLTACGGGTPADNTGGDTNTGEVNTTDCTATPFDTNCDADESAITSRQTTCFASATANRRCGVVIAGACVANPFRAETACMADTYLPARIAECIKGGEADEGKCATITTDAEKNTMITSCLKNPFDIVCKMTVTDFATYTDTARMNRLTFCNDGGNVANDFCTGNNLVIICEADPFHAICFTDDTYFPNRVNNCITAGNAGESKCNNLLTDTAMNTELTACLTNPFATACESVTAFTDFALARTNRVSFCDMAGNNTNALCMGANLMGVCDIDSFNAICLTDTTYDPNRQTRQVQCVADSTAHTNCPVALRSLDGVVDITDITGITTPTGVIDHADLPATVAEAVADTNIPSHFLSVGADGVIDRAGLGRATPATTLSRTGDAMDGVTYVSGSVENVTQSFVGLLPNTNLGAPLIEAPMDTTWRGRYYLLLNNATHPITFNVTFGAGDQAGTITTDPDIRGTYTTTFTLSFTAEGVITGNVLLDSLLPDDTAQARGLIGEQGLVGVFANTDGGIWGGSLHGGFVANYTAPPPPNPCIAAGDCVDTAAWLAARTPTPPDLPETPRKNQFLKGTSTGFADRANLNIRDVEGLPLVVTTIQTIPFANTDTAAGGAAFFGGELYNGDNASGNDFYYAGVLAGTNVGAPITEIITAEANIRWTGEIRGNATNSSARFTDGEIANFGLNITFDGNDGGTLKSFFAADTVLHFAIDGTFNANGIITGKVELGNRMGTTSTIRNNNIYSPGTLSGIIGQDGVVGVYYSNNNNAASLDGYSGGFIARPTPSE